MKRVQIIIPSINLWTKYTKDCIDSVFNQKTENEYRILFIDNASTDETLIEAGKLVSDKFSHKRNEERWSFSQSVNHGVNDAWERGYDYALVLNNDIILHSQALDELVKRFESADESIGMVSCLDIRGEVDTVGIESISNKQGVPESEHPNFSAFMINKTCWDRVGEFDEVFRPAYWEDNDIHYRINLAGLKAICLPTAMFYHFGSRTQNEAENSPICSSPQFEKNAKYYCDKWGGLPPNEKFIKPFNREENTLKSTEQNGIIR